jgi:hypothetical protein
MKRTLPILAMGLMLMGAAGCAPARLYQGEPKPASEISVVEGSWYFWGLAEQLMGICRVDETWLVKKDDYAERPTRRVELLPGRHDIEVCYYRANAGTAKRSPFNRAFFVELQAGHLYKIGFETERGPIHLWLEDKATGEKTWDGQMYPPPAKWPFGM